jgi:hypothetical protein
LRDDMNPYKCELLERGSKKRCGVTLASKIQFRTSRDISEWWKNIC